MKELNPSLIGNHIPTGHPIRVPKGKLTQVATALRNVPEDKRAIWRLHRAEDGDTLATIAKRYNANSSALESANPQIVSTIDPGDFVVVPAVPVVVAAARPAGYYYRGRWVATKAPVRTATNVKRVGPPAKPNTAARSTTANAKNSVKAKAPIGKASAANTGKKPAPKRA